jgi:hypothetical protein
VSDNVSHPYKTTGKITFVYTLNCIFLNNKLEDKIFITEWYQTFPDFSLPLISTCIEFCSFRSLPNISALSPLQKNYYQSILWLHPACWSPDMTFIDYTHICVPIISDLPYSILLGL